jgi:hypothetical protein
MVKQHARCVVWTAGALLVAIGCRTARPSKAPTTATLEGRASYEAVPDPDATASKLIPQLDYIPAAPAEGNRPPVYPEELVTLGLPPQKIVLRLVVDEQGQIADIRPSRFSSEVDRTYRDAFEGAIRKAVEKWRFRPARRRTFVDSPDDGSGQPPYQVLKSESPAPTYFDVRFVFEVHEGKGVVREGP